MSVLYKRVFFGCCVCQFALARAYSDERSNVTSSAFVIDPEEEQVYRCVPIELSIEALEFHPHTSRQIFLGFGVFCSLRYDLRDGAIRDLYLHKGSFPKLSTDDKENRLITAAGREICVWHIGDARKIRQVKIPGGECDFITALAHCQNTGRIAVGTMSGNIHFIDSKESKVRSIWRWSIEQQLELDRKLRDRVDADIRARLESDIRALLESDTDCPPSVGRPGKRGEDEDQRPNGSFFKGEDSNPGSRRALSHCFMSPMVCSLAIAPNGDKLLIGYQGHHCMVVLYNIATERASVSYSAYTSGAFVNVEGGAFVALGRPDRISFLKMSKLLGKPDWSIELPKEKRLVTFRVSPTTRYAALSAITVGRSRELSVWDLSGRKRLWNKGVADVPGALSFSWDEKVLACGQGSKIILLDTQTGRLLEQASLPSVFVKEKLAREKGGEGQRAWKCRCPFCAQGVAG